MFPPHRPNAPSKLISRIAVSGMFMAVVALGVLAIWSAIVTQNGAHQLSQAGVQTSGHLRALQALSLIDTSTDALEEGPVAAELAKLRNAQQVLDESLVRMEAGEVDEARQIARKSKPLAQQLKSAVTAFLALPPDFRQRWIRAGGADRDHPR